MESRIFTDFSKKEIDFFIENTKFTSFDADTIIFHENDNAIEMYLIKSDKVKVFINRKQKDIELATLSNGDFFGEMAILRQNTRSASIKTIEKTEIYIIDTNTIASIIEKDSILAAKFFFNLAEVLAERLASTDKEVENWYLINDALVKNEQFRKMYFRTHKE